MRLVKNLSIIREQASNLWYSEDEIEFFKASFFGRVREVRSQLRQNSALIDEGCITINAAAILGLEKHLTHELTAEYMKRRDALQWAVAAEHRQHHAMLIPRATATARLATVSAQHSQWARERARAAAVFLEQDVMQDMKDMNLQAKTPLRCSMPRLNEAGAVEEGALHPCQRRWEVDAAGGDITSNDDGAVPLGLGAQLQLLETKCKQCIS